MVENIFVLMGLKLDLHIIRTVGPVALASGLGQVIFTSAIGYLLALALGISQIMAIYVAVALTFFSIIIIKLLSDKREGVDLTFIPYADAAREAADRLFPHTDTNLQTNTGVSL